MEGVDEDMEGVAEWERGLPGLEEMTPLSQILITAELSCAFSISPEPCKTLMDVTRASHNTLSSLRRHNSAPAKTMSNPDGISATEPNNDEDIGGAQTVPRDNKVESHAKNVANKCSSSGGGAEGGGSTANGGCGGDENEDQSERALKRQRLVWTPELHKRFVDVVAHLGIKNAVPKTIMQLMNVEGLTRENVASHLQKYRLYLKRQGHSDDGAGPADPIFSSSPKFNPFHKDGQYNQQFHPQHNQFQHMPMPMPMPMMPYGNSMVQMPVMGIAHNSQPAPHGGGLYPNPCGSGSFGMSMPHSGDRGQMHNDLNFRTATK